MLQACQDKAEEARQTYWELRHLEEWAKAATDLELLNWMRGQWGLDLVSTSTFLSILL